MDLNTMLRVLSDIWSWKPDARPETVRRAGTGLIFRWRWYPGLRAVQRLRHLQLHEQLFQGLRRRTYIPGTHEELPQFLEQVRVQAAHVERALPCVSRFRLSLSDLGCLTLLAEDTTEKRRKRLEEDHEGRELDEEDEAEPVD